MDQRDGNEQKEGCRYRVLVIGAARVGKTALVLKYATKKPFNPWYETTAGCIPYDVSEQIAGIGKIDAQGRISALKIWDCTGKDRFRVITTSYFSSMDGFLLVFDITDKTSFEKAKEWLVEIRKRSSTHAQILLVGNMADQHSLRKVEGFEAAEWAEAEGLLPYSESSAMAATLTGPQPFSVLLKAIADYYRDLPGGKPVELNPNLEMPVAYFPLVPEEEAERIHARRNCKTQ